MLEVFIPLVSKRALEISASLASEVAVAVPIKQCKFPQFQDQQFFHKSYLVDRSQN